MMSSASTIMTQKSAKIIEEIQILESKRANGKNENVESRIEELQNELLSFMT